MTNFAPFKIKIFNREFYLELINSSIILEFLNVYVHGNSDILEITIEGKTDRLPALDHRQIFNIETEIESTNVLLGNCKLTQYHYVDFDDLNYLHLKLTFTTFIENARSANERTPNSTSQIPKNKEILNVKNNWRFHGF